MTVIDQKYDIEITTPKGNLRLSKKEWDCLVSNFKQLPSWAELIVHNNVRPV